MDDDEDVSPCMQHMFRSFICSTLAVLLCIQAYNFFWASDNLDSDVSDVKYVVMQLTRGLSEVNRKHESLRSEIERIAAVIPSAAAAASRAQDTLMDSTALHNVKFEMPPGGGDYDRKVTDFALESAGGRVIDTGDTVEHVLYESPVSYALHILASMACRGYECYSARAMIRPGALPGECWAFKGSRGEATIRLLGSIRVTGVSIEHIPAHISPTKEISSAPRLFQLEGLDMRGDPFPHDFGSFEYDKDGTPIQFFEVRHIAPRSYNLVKLRILTNWGHPVYTCVYRVRIHGDLDPALTSPGITDDEIMRVENE